MIGQGEGFHAKIAGSFQEPVDAAGSIEETVIGVDVEMNKFLIGGGHDLLPKKGGGNLQLLILVLRKRLTNARKRGPIFGSYSIFVSTYVY
jgi:hypothetical protein